MGKSNKLYINFLALTNKAYKENIKYMYYELSVYQKYISNNKFY